MPDCLDVRFFFAMHNLHQFGQGCA
jgi:hypothetical protein